MARPQEFYYARRPHGYGELGQLSQGEVIQLRGYVNDELLVRIGYLDKLPANAHPVQCGACDRWFLDDRWRTQHGDREHRRREEGLEVVEAGGADPTGRYEGALVDATGDREAQRLEQEAPLYLEHTTASQKG